MRKRGYHCEIVEKWIYPPGREHGIRKDILGCDIFCVHPTMPTALIQTTSAGNQAARKTKLLDIEPVRWFVRQGNIVEVHSWGTTKRDGKDRYRGKIERLCVDALGEFTWVQVDEVMTTKPNRKPKAPQPQMKAFYGL